MVSLRLLILIKAMTIWNYIRDIYINISMRISRFYEYMNAYFKNYPDTWLFIPGHTLPLPVSNIRNEISGSWIYDNFDNTLRYCTELSNNIHICRFSWLSASIRITDPLLNNKVTEYAIDEFLERLRIYTIGDTCPTLTTTYMTWCAYNKHWFNNNCKIEFKVITEFGDEEVLNINCRRVHLCVRPGKIFSVLDKTSCD